VDYRFLNQFANSLSWANKALSVKRGYGLAYLVRGETIEASVPYCQNEKNKNKLEFEDKLVYELAYNEFVKAKNDPVYISRANTKIKYVMPLIPTKEDRFMNQNKTITSSCYDFVK
jgi:hypothetical protein